MPDRPGTMGTQDQPLPAEWPPEAEILDGFLSDLEARQDARARGGLDTGFRFLNQVTGGLKDRLYILGAPPACGKTTLAKQIADQVAERNRVPVLLFEYEQSAAELRIKSLSRLSGVINEDIDNGRITKVEDLPGVGPIRVWEKVRKAAEQYRQFAAWVHVIEAGAQTTMSQVREIAVAVRQQQEAERLLIVIDYLQIVPPENARQYGTTKDRVDGMASDLKRLARDLRSPVLAISSLNRDAYRDGEKPVLSSFKESGGIEYGADFAGALWTDPQKTARLRKQGSPDHPDYRRAVQFCVLKNRFGAQGEIELTYHPTVDTFEEKGFQPADYSQSFGGATR